MLTVVYRPEYLTYDFGEGHPFAPVRWEALADLLESFDLEIEWVRPEPAAISTILDVHDHAFVDTVTLASEGQQYPLWGQYGLGTGDVPVFHGMHDATRVICGGSVTAGRILLDGTENFVLQLGGGLHHAMRARAAGFCVYNDVAMLIRTLKSGGLRVAYVDVDVHHGDGVQSIFYDDPHVLTVSLHESGRYLFPGTGWIDETGSEKARGSAVNLPLHPATEDESYLESFDAVVPAVVRSFAPDVFVVEAGADAHFADPLAHLSLTSRCFDRVFGRLVGLADELTAGRMVATLGGGYAFASTIRVWSILAHHLARTALPETFPSRWVDLWESKLDVAVPKTVLEPEPEPARGAPQESAAEVNRRTVSALLENLEQTR